MEKAWTGLKSLVQPDGKVGWTQLIGAYPNDLYRRQVGGVGVPEPTCSPVPKWRD